MVGGEAFPFEFWRSGRQRSSLATAVVRPLDRPTKRSVPKRDALLIALVCPIITSADIEVSDRSVARV